MSRRNHKPKRCKRYVPKHVHIPVLRGLRDEFGFVLHASLAAAEAGHFSKDHYDRIGGLLNTIWGAMELRPPKEASVKLVIEGAMRAMNQAGDRGAATGVWSLRDLEQAAIIAGIQKAEEYLPKMDVLTLHESITRFKVMQIEEEARNAKQAEPRYIMAKEGDNLVKVPLSEIRSITIAEMDENNNPVNVHKIVRGTEERIAA